MTPTRREFVLGISGAALASACHRKDEGVVLQGAHPNEMNGAPPTKSSAVEPRVAAASPSAKPKPLSDLTRRPLGKTGAMVSMIGLGGFHIGKPKDEKVGIRLVRDAVDAGINFLDNCWDYNEGESELRMGKALRDGYRQKVFLMTKLDGRTRSAATAQLEQSLQRLQTDVIDLVQVHEVIRDTDPARAFDDNGVIRALQDAKKAGKLRYIGFTGHKDPKIHLAMLKAAEKHGFEFDTVQMTLNVLDAHFRSFEEQVLPVLAAKGIGVLGMKSLADGEIVKKGIASASECIRYALSLPTSVVICGMDKPEVLEQNLAIARDFVPLGPEERRSLLDRTRAAAAKGDHESFKTSHDHDGTVQNPHWLEEAKI